jgi:N-acetylmuramic acid 6-phosphate etherase
LLTFGSFRLEFLRLGFLTGGQVIATDDTFGEREGGFLEELLASQRRAVEAVAGAITAIGQAAAAISARVGAGGRLIYLGAGSSGLIALQDGAELPGTFGLDSSRIVFLIAGGVTRAHEIDAASEDDVEAAKREIGALGSLVGDVVVAVSASGATPYTLAGARAARAKGALVVALANRAGSQLLEEADCPVLLDSGAEALKGSTRLAAGTAQKCALGLISTYANARLGHIYQGLMVNVRPENEKLRRRAIDIISSIAGVDETAASTSLACAAGNVKCAVLIASGARSKEEAEALVKSVEGNIGAALSRLSNRTSMGAEF